LSINLSSFYGNSRIAENNLIELLKEFDIFERNKISLEIKLTASDVLAFFKL